MGELDELLARGERIIEQRLNSTRTEVVPLTTAQITELLEALPLVPTTVPQIQRNEWIGRVRELHTQLKRIKLHPNGFIKLKQMLVLKFYWSMIQPGANVGLGAADAAGTNTTQMTLNTFHTAGSATNAAYGIKAIGEILDLLARTNKSCHIVYNELLSFERIMTEKRPELIDVKFEDLIRMAQIETMPDQFPPWYAEFADIYDREVINRAQYYLRTVIDLDRLYASHITSDQLYTTMRDSNKAANAQLTIIFSPLIDGSIEFHFIPNEAKIEGGDSLTYLSTQSSLILKKQLQGLDNVKEIYIIRVSLVKAFTEERRLPSTTNPKQFVYQLYFDPYVNHSNGIRTEYLVALLEFVGYTVVGRHADHLEVVEGWSSLPKPDEDRGVPPEGSPLEELRRRMREDDENQAEYEKGKRQEKLEVAMRDKRAAREISILRPPSQFELRAYTHYVETKGGSLTDALDLTRIDYEATYSNDVREVNYQFGIEASRDLLTKEIDQVFKNSKQPLERSSVTLLADHMTVRGFLTPFNLSGIAAHPVGVYTRSTLQKPVENFAKAALQNESDPIRTASACLMTGRMPQLSTGIVRLIYEQKESDYEDFVEPELLDLPAQAFVEDEEEAAEEEERDSDSDREEEEEELGHELEEEKVIERKGDNTGKGGNKPPGLPKGNYPPPTEYQDKAFLTKLEGRARLTLQNHPVQYSEEHPLVHIRRLKLVQDVIAELMTQAATFPRVVEKDGKYLREAITAWIIEQKAVDEREQDPVLPYPTTKPELVDFAFVKRMIERGVPQAQAEELAKRVAEGMKGVVDDLQVLKKKKALFKGVVTASYNKRAKLWEYNYEDSDTYMVSIPTALNEKLRKEYDGDRDQQSTRIFNLLVRYELLFGSGYQGAVPTDVFSISGATYEAFASPLNHTLENYYSLYPDTDSFFGSRGSFFLAPLTGGSYEVNPPFLESSILAMTEKLLEQLQQTEIVTFLIVLPAWSDLPSYRALLESEYNRLPNRVVVLRAREHKFRDVPAGKEWQHGVDTHVFLLSNDGTKKVYGPEFEQQVRGAFA